MVLLSLMLVVIGSVAATNKDGGNNGTVHGIPHSPPSRLYREGPVFHRQGSAARQAPDGKRKDGLHKGVQAFPDGFRSRRGSSKAPHHHIQHPCFALCLSWVCSTTITIIFIGAVTVLITAQDFLQTVVSVPIENTPIDQQGVIVLKPVLDPPHGFEQSRKTSRGACRSSHGTLLQYLWRRQIGRCDIPQRKNPRLQRGDQSRYCCWLDADVRR
mmetsp:Transcript_15296/g.31387  ORF Transcript_15296/g.31387 Transcript_15296/m.31387 type:complete len:214 (+) Transcript_15296:2085-2726(+)